MAAVVQVVIDGPPVPKARPRFDTRRGRVYTPSKSQAAEDAVAMHFLPHQTKLYGNKPLIIDVQFHVKRWRGDLDNFVKLVLDAMQKARVMEDDRWVHELHAHIFEQMEKEMTVVTAGFR